MLAKAFARFEALLKGMVFDCHACGQCVLKLTGYTCPMVCPKGLRNGPCGGTLHGECEVYPERECVWVRIHERRSKKGNSGPLLLPSPDARLFNTSSYLNLLSGKDTLGRKPLECLDLGRGRTRQPLQTKSRLEARLKSGAFVMTCELRSPRTANFERFDREALTLKETFDAVNATAFLNAKPSLPSPMAAGRLAQLGMEAVCQSTCRDHTKTSFISELLSNELNGVNNVLCLTGDSYASIPKIKQVFDMDAALMLYEARYLREKGSIHFTGDSIINPPRTFLGAAMNPFTEPMHVPLARLKQKIDAGADFIQTQVIFNPERFTEFMKGAVDQGLNEDIFLLPGIPVVTSRKALSILPRMPGVHLPESVFRRLHKAKDLEREGMLFAREMIEKVKELRGVSGVHLMLFGPDHSILNALVAPFKNREHTAKE